METIQFRTLENFKNPNSALIPLQITNYLFFFQSFQEMIIEIIGQTLKFPFAFGGLCIRPEHTFSYSNKSPLVS